jgi:hypothetical protein
MRRSTNREQMCRMVESWQRSGMSLQAYALKHCMYVINSPWSLTAP